ncbi:MAG: Imidazoleglycerol-phosphate dehydratase [Methanocorpusculum sp. MCE]|nr:MAG: Imidazoleglycerol-phosphate dehydratase [Methanocorpusculum sp. MCE]
MRSAEKSRETKETNIRVFFDPDTPGTIEISTGVPFMDHMLNAFARHAGFSNSSFPEGVRFLRRRSAEAEHGGARKMRLARIRGDSRLNNLLSPHLVIFFPDWIEDNTA